MSVFLLVEVEVKVVIVKKGAHLLFGCATGGQPVFSAVLTGKIYLMVFKLDNIRDVRSQSVGSIYSADF